MNLDFKTGFWASVQYCRVNAYVSLAEINTIRVITELVRRAITVTVKQMSQAKELCMVVGGITD